MSPTPREALIVAHGQPSAPVPPELWLAAFAAQVESHLTGWRIRSATLAAWDALEQQASDMPDGSPIFPMFMADGWFTTKVLPRRLADHPATVLPPFGFDPDLPQLAANFVRANQGAATHLLLAAHGSARGQKAAQSAYNFADRLRPLLPDLDITCGFIEQPPFIDQAATPLPDTSICLPFFALEGDHCREDIPQALVKARFSGKILPPLGLANDVPLLVADAIQRA
ncbi:MAG: CbiX/SirB N-terminal domain-containing protein [Shimia sp.]|uniref:CbiX/SirB N-terminal domain-containing protein n=1 Tax=Shimia sp. TaxID=1954381 RepID=UPI00405A2691